MTSDESLMLKFQAGSRASFEELFHRYRQPIYAFFRRRLPSRSTAEDLAQETWMAVLNGRSNYVPAALFRSYLYGIAFKLIAAERRRSAKLKSTMGVLANLSSASNANLDHWVREAFAKLDDTEREILMLREYEQLTYEEIATLIDIPINTVRSRLFRARLAMNRLLEPDTETALAQERSR
jgi:RNA polymerase sigma factor (sigma-70 family)